MDALKSPIIFETPKRTYSKLLAIGLASTALIGCGSNSTDRASKEVCQSVSGVIKHGQELGPGPTDIGTLVKIVNVFGSRNDNYSAVVIDTKEQGPIKQLPVVDFGTSRAKLPTGEFLLASTLQTETTAVDAFIKICPATK